MSMKVYADYQYYTDTYGGDMNEDEFKKHAIRASAFIRNITFGRSDEVELEEIKYACCEMCNAMKEISSGQEDGKTVKSASNDGYSVSYVTESDGSSFEETRNARLAGIARLYLGETGLLCRAVPPSRRRF